MATTTATDVQILNAILGKEEERIEALKSFFTNKTLKENVIGYVTNHQGNLQDGEDVFQDTIILFDRAIRDGSFKGQSSLSSFFMGIAKWRWYGLKRKYGGNIEFVPEKFDEPFDNVEGRMIDLERREIIEEILTKIGGRCKEVLRLYELSYSMEDIAKEMGLAGPDVAKKMAYECRKKFREFCSDKPEYKNILNIT
jgi:RNA polymerase sigma factor (sigma-70 family)